MRRTLACVVIGLFFLTAAKVNAVVEIDGKCMEDCQSEGNTKGLCRNQCTAKSEPSNSTAPAVDRPKIYSECVMPCRNQGNTPDFCKSICNY
jgi:hypothetical protein